MNRLKAAFLVSVSVGIAMLLLSWSGDKPTAVGPAPSAPDYADSTQWFMADRQGEADVFYIISTETGDHMIGNDTSHYADTHDAYQRSRMRHEMYAVDSFYSGRFNYYSPYYRQASIQSWVSEELAYSRLPLAMDDCIRSWEYYLAHYNQGRPFVLAGFSQGAVAVMEIMRRMPDSVAARFVAAYIIGYKVTAHDTATCRLLRPATGATDTGVTICFNSAKSPECEIDLVSGGNLYGINPVNWRTDTVSTPFVLYGKKQNDTLFAHYDPESRMVLVDGYKNNKPMPVFGVPGNYHHMELKFYYPYIRKNIADRVDAYFSRKLERD